MKTIWKYQIRPDTKSLPMPLGAKLLFVGIQGGEVQLWAEVDPAQPMRARAIACYGTGHDMPDNPGSHVGTFMTHGGALVFHVYDEGSHGLTEEHIERFAEFRMDALDRAFLSSGMTQDEYEREVAAIDLETNRLVQSAERARK